MVESRAPTLPRGQTAPRNPAAENAQRGRQSVAVRSVPDGVAQSRGVRVEARVERISQDGTVRLQSSRGPIEIQVNDPRALAQLREGQTVQVDIPPPPRGEAAPPQVDLIISDPVEIEVQPRNYTTPVDVEITTTQDTAATAQENATTAPPRLTPDSSVPTYPIRVENISIEQLITYLPTVAPDAFRADVSNLQATVEALPLPSGETVIRVDAGLIPTATSSIIEALPATISLLPALEVAQPSVQTPPTPSILSEQSVPPVGAAVSIQVSTTAVSSALNGLQDIGASLQGVPPQASTQNVYLTQTSPPLAFVQNTPDADGSRLSLQSVNAHQGAEAPLVSNPITLGQQAGQLNAIVVAQTPENLPVVLAFQGNGEPSGFFVLHAPFETITPGLQIHTVPQEIGVGENGAQITTQPLPVLPLLPFSFLNAEPWPALDQIQQVLAQTAPQVAQAFSNIIPSASSPAQIVPAALFFIAALRGGNLQDWVGERAVDALHRAGKSDLVGRLGQEGALLSRAAGEPNAQDWRALSLPFLWDNEINKVVLHYKQDGGPDHNDDDQKGTQTRFVFDLSMNAMGAVQIDGLFRPGRLDVILRSEDHFSQAMQAEMRRVYAESLRHTEVSGELSFQTRLDSWVKINSDNRNDGVQV